MEVLRVLMRSNAMIEYVPLEWLLVHHKLCVKYGFDVESGQQVRGTVLRSRLSLYVSLYFSQYFGSWDMRAPYKLELEIHCDSWLYCYLNTMYIIQ